MGLFSRPCGTWVNAEPVPGVGEKNLLGRQCEAAGVLHAQTLTKAFAQERCHLPSEFNRRRGGGKQGRRWGTGFYVRSQLAVNERTAALGVGWHIRMFRQNCMTKDWRAINRLLDSIVRPSAGRIRRLGVAIWQNDK